MTENAKVETQTIAPYGSDEYYAAWDAAGADELVAAIAAWNTGEGTVESPWHPVPNDETIAEIRAHEVAGQNREAVLDAIDTKIAEVAQNPAPTREDEPEPETEAATPPVDNEAPYGWDVIGADSRRIVRGVAESAAREFANTLKSSTGERLKVKPATAPILGPASDEQ